MRAHALSHDLGIARLPKPEIREIGIFHDLEFVLLVGVEVFVECVRGESDCFGDETGEEDGYRAHLCDVAREDGLEVWEVGGGWPEGGREEVAIEGLGGGADGVVG